MKRWSFVLLLLLVAACAPTPPTATLAPSVTPSPWPTLVPTLTSSPVPTLQPSITPAPTLTPTPLQISPLIGYDIEPPISIDLPSDWQRGYDTIAYNDVGTTRSIPFALYTGPVTGGRGFIVLLWNFHSVTTSNPYSEAFGVRNLYADGLRLLRQIIIEADCNLGTDIEYDYPIGERMGTGTQFTAVDCAQLGDTRGWFVALPVDGMNFAFYAYTEPLAAMNGPAEQELQTILETVRFDVAAFRAALTLTPSISD